MTEEWVTSKIINKTTTGDHEVEGKCRGGLGVIQSPMVPEPCFLIIHIASGTSCLGPFACDTEENAIEWADYMLSFGDFIDWTQSQEELQRNGLAVEVCVAATEGEKVMIESVQNRKLGGDTWLSTN